MVDRCYVNVLINSCNVTALDFPRTGPLATFFFIRVYDLFLYDDGLKKARFSFGHFICHKSPKTGQHDMKVIKSDLFEEQHISVNLQQMSTLLLLFCCNAIFK